MEYYNSFHSITEFIKQGKGRLLVDQQRCASAVKAQTKGKKSRLLQLVELAKEHNITVEQRPTQELQGILEQSHYRGFILELRETEQNNAKISSLADVVRKQPPLVLLLDSILDVGNLGALLRSSDLFGVGAVFVAHRSAGRERGSINQLSRAASGATAWVPLIEGNLVQVARELHEAGYWLYAADMSGEAASSVQFEKPCALLLGAEERGLSAQLRELSDFCVRIPTQGHLDSLNVSAAGAVLLYEISRQNRPS